MKNSTATQKREVEFNTTVLQPRSLICFSDSYTKHLPTLREYLIKNEGRYADIVLAKILKSGEFGTRCIRGYLIKVTEDSFILRTNADFSSAYEEEREIEFHFNDVCGEVPLHIDYYCNPFTLSHNSKLYLEKLIEMRNLLKKCVGKIHAATLYFQCDDEDVFKVECEILSVKPTLLVKQFRSSFRDKQNVSLGVIKKMLRAVKLNGYLYKVSVVFDIEHKISPIDDGHTSVSI